MTKYNSAILIHLPESEILHLLSKMFESGIGFEMLNPKLIDQKWQDIVYLDSKFDKILDSKISIFKQVIARFDRLSFWQDSKISGELNSFFLNKSETEFFDFAQRMLRPNFDINSNNAAAIHDGLQYTDLISGFKASLTKLQIQKRSEHLRSKFFKINTDSQAIFALISISPDSFESLFAILDTLKIEFEIYDWVEKIRSWDEDESSLAVLPIIKNNLIPNSNFRLSFRLFKIATVLVSGIIIGDLLFGICLILFWLFFRSQKTISTEWKIHSKNILLIGLISSLIGVVEGRFGSNLLENFSAINNLFKSFRLIDLNGMDTNLPFNQIFDRMNWQMTNFGVYLNFVFASFLVFVSILISFLYNLKNDKNKILPSSVWILSIVVVIVTLVFHFPFAFVLIPLPVLFLVQNPNQFYNFIYGEQGLRGYLKLGLQYCSYFCFLPLSIFGLVVSAKINQVFSFIPVVSLIGQIVFGLVFGLFVYGLILNILFSNFLKTNSASKDKLLKSENDFEYWSYH